MIAELQEKIIEVLETEQLAPAGGKKYPEKIKPYEGELIDPKKHLRGVGSLVAVEVGEIPSIQHQDTTGNEVRFNASVEVIGIVRNEKGSEARRSAGAELVDFMLTALQGKKVYVGDSLVYLTLNARVSTVPDLLHPYYAAVYTLNVFIEN